MNWIEALIRHREWLIPIIGAFIGWLTNLIAIRLLFRPYKPINIMGFRIQGILPKRQKEIAAAVGEVVESELVSIESILKAVEENKIDRRLVRKGFYILRERIDERLPFFLPASLKRTIRNYIMKQAKEEIRNTLPYIAEGIIKELKKEVSLRGMVEKRVSSFDFKKLEEVVMKVSKKEFRFVEIVGGVLGFLIGIIQIILVRGW